MSGDELKEYIRRSGMSVADVAKELGTSPQNLNARFKRKSVKTDFWQKIKDIIDKCCPPLPVEMESAVLSPKVNGSNNNVNQSIGNDAALERENELLRQQNDFLQKQVETLLKIVGNNNK